MKDQLDNKSDLNICEFNIINNDCEKIITILCETCQKNVCTNCSEKFHKFHSFKYYSNLVNIINNTNNDNDLNKVKLEDFNKKVDDLCNQQINALNHNCQGKVTVIDNTLTGLENIKIDLEQKLDEEKKIYVSFLLGKFGKLKENLVTEFKSKIL